ncbi:MAG: hypothetical protein LC768_04210 [Acidobacteria bacterium]|nr:hypothetical protein [Acidobacteriota bacterium]MCA1637529.1 hypothetical protein [Acidobacteriota bacterium]
MHFIETTKKSLAFLFLCPIFFGISTIAQEKDMILKSWKKTSACKISFLIPKSVKNLDAKEIDSCVAEFENKTIRISIDYGWYGSNFTKIDTMLEFNEETIEIDGKKAQLVSYIDGSIFAKQHPKEKYVMGIYVNLSEGQTQEIMKTSLKMKVAAKSKKEMQTAKQIFHSIKFQ